VEIPTVTRNIGTVELNETVVVLVHNASGWFSVPSSGYSLEGGVLTLFNIDTADIDEVSLKFEGRRLGDATGDGKVNIGDAVAIARSLLLTEKDLEGNAVFYADVNNVGKVNIGSAMTVARSQLINQLDDNYQII